MASGGSGREWVEERSLSKMLNDAKSNNSKKINLQINRFVNGSSIESNFVGLHGKVFCSGGGYSGGFYEKLLEAFPMSDSADTSQLQDGPAAGQG